MKKVAWSILAGLLPMVALSSLPNEARAGTTTVKGVFKLVGENFVGASFLSPGEHLVHLRRDEKFDSLINADQIVIRDRNIRGAGYNTDSGCAVMSGDLWCWGENSTGRLGDGTTNESSGPKKVLEGVRDVYSHTYSTCAVRTNSDLVCTGGDRLSDNQPISEGVDVDGRTRKLQATNFGDPIQTGVVSIVDGGILCIAMIDRRVLCTRKEHPKTSTPAAETWTWFDSGLKSDGSVVVSSRFNVNAVAIPEKYAGQDYGLCTVDEGRVYCAWIGFPKVLDLSMSLTFGEPRLVAGVEDVTQLYESTGLLFAYSQGVLHLGATSLEYGIPEFLHPLAAVDGFLGVAEMPVTAVITESGLFGVTYDDEASLHKRSALFPLTRFDASTASDSHRVSKVLGRTNSAQLIPMDVAVGARKSRGPTRVKVLAAGAPIVGATVAWRTADRSSVMSWSPASESKTNSNGEVLLPSLSTGPVSFTVLGGISGGSYLTVADVLIDVDDSPVAVVRIPSPPKSRNQRFTITTALGEPVPSAVVTLSNLYRTYAGASDHTGSASWALSLPVRSLYAAPDCPGCYAGAPSLITGEDGTVEFRVYETKRRWKPLAADLQRLVGADVTVSYDDGVVKDDAITTITSSNQTIVLDIAVTANITGSRDVIVGANGGLIRHDGTTSSDPELEAVCAAVFTGGLWDISKSFVFTKCTSIVYRESARRRAVSLECSGGAASGNSVQACVKQSMFVRLRTSGRAPSRAVCLVVAGKPCVTQTKEFYGVPVVLKSGRSIAVRELVGATKTAKVSASVSGSSMKLCRVAGARLTALRGAGTCSIVVTTTRGKRAHISTVRVLVAQ